MTAELQSGEGQEGMARTHHARAGVDEERCGGGGGCGSSGMMMQSVDSGRRDGSKFCDDAKGRGVARELATGVATLQDG